MQSYHADNDPRRWRALIVLLSATFMAQLDAFIVNVAVPDIQINLHASSSAVQFVLAGFTLAYSVLIVTGSRLGDLFGRKRLFQFGMLGFTVSSALCGLAWSALSLILFRVLQGISAAAMMPQIFPFIRISFPANERGRAFSLYGATIGLASIMGQLLGGLLISQNVFGLGWRAVFLVNLPIGVLALLAGIPLLRESRSSSVNSLDGVGAFILSVSLFVLVYPLVQGREAGWPWWSIALLISFPVSMTLFILYERHLLGNGGAPALPPTLFRDRPFALGISLILVFYAIASSLFFTLAVTLQHGFGYSALTSGMAYLPLGIGFFLTSLVSSKFTQQYGPSVLLFGDLITIIGIAITMQVVHHQSASLVWSDMLPGLFVIGLGLGTCAAPLNATILSGVHQDNAGQASGVMTTATQLSTAFGVCFVGIFYYHAFAQSIGPSRAVYAHAFEMALTFALALAIAYAFLLILLTRSRKGNRSNEADLRATTPHSH
ncbi:MFS transporter [Alicyclobacillus curvatus]|nr:MFS transporter [Alicyclobacillus curvatus]